MIDFNTIETGAVVRVLPANMDEHHNGGERHALPGALAKVIARAPGPDGFLLSLRQWPSGVVGIWEPSESGELELVTDETEKAKLNPVQVMVPYEFDYGDLRDLLITAYEGGIDYWADTDAPDKQGEDDRRTPSERWADAILAGGTVSVRELDDTDVMPFGLFNLRPGIAKTAIEYPDHFQDFVKDNVDATTADVIVQMSLLGHVVYG
jgi:hypothetical protein